MHVLIKPRIDVFDSPDYANTCKTGSINQLTARSGIFFTTAGTNLNLWRCDPIFGAFDLAFDFGNSSIAIADFTVANDELTATVAAYIGDMPSVWSVLPCVLIEIDLYMGVAGSEALMFKGSWELSAVNVLPLPTGIATPIANYQRTSADSITLYQFGTLDTLNVYDLPNGTWLLPPGTPKNYPVIYNDVIFLLTS